MKANQMQLADIFGDKTTLIVPVYQRNYDWRKEQCDKLFSDIENIVRGGGTHFLGTIVCQDRQIGGMFKEHVIVDGQQRITSIILFAKAIFDFINDEETRQAIQVTFFKHAVPNKKYAFKLQPTEYDADIFKKLLGNENLDAQEKNSRLYVNYQFFKDKISQAKTEIPPEDFHQAIYQLQIVHIVLENENPQQIFESLNTTGKDLTEAEKIRNYLLMNLNDAAQENLYKNYWLPMERLLQNSETMERFMVQYLVAKRKSSKYMQGKKNLQISTKSLYETFKQYFQKNYGGDKAQKVEEFFKDMLFNAKFYRRLIFTPATKFDDLSALDRKFYELVYLLDSTSAPIILMYLNERYTRGEFDTKNFIQMVDALISLGCRAKVCRQVGIDSSQNAGNIINRFDKLENIGADSIWQAITHGKGKYTFPSDENFQQALMSPELNLSLKNFCKYLLYSFERNLNHGYNFVGYSDLSVELVMPKKLTAAWKKYLQEKNDPSAEMLVNALGNLALVAETNKNAAFSDKKIRYATSNFFYTRSLMRAKDWTSRQVRSRTEFFAKLALSIWILPEKYRHEVIKNANIFTLDGDFARFTKKSPATVFISGKEYRVAYWIDFLRTVARELYALDSENFRQVVQNSGRSSLFSSNPKILKNPVEIDKNYYIGAGLDTKDCLSFINFIVENFDRLSDTNFKDEIWFTLRE